MERVRQNDLDTEHEQPKRETDITSNNSRTYCSRLLFDAE